jgi:hypothetical protein
MNYISWSYTPSIIYSQHIIQPTHECIFRNHALSNIYSPSSNSVYNPHVKCISYSRLPSNIYSQHYTTHTWKYISYSRLPSNIYWHHITQPTHELYFVIMHYRISTHTHVFHRTSTHSILYNPHMNVSFVIMHYRISTHPHPTQYTTHYMRSDKKMYFILTSSIEHLLTTYYTTHTLIYIS